MPSNSQFPCGASTGFYRFATRCVSAYSLRIGWKSVVIAVLLALTPTAFALAQAPPVSIASPPPNTRTVVVVDAAHGGSDSGANLDGHPEKTYTLAMSIRLRSLLAARGISVVTTRESDTAVDSVHRAEITDHANAQACLTLHASETGNGIHLYISSLPPARHEFFEPWKTAQSAWVARSVALEGVLNSALRDAGLAVLLGRTALPVVDSMTCPAVAVEISPAKSSSGGSGSSVPGSLADPAYQAQIANALAGALLEWRTEGSHL